MSDTMNYDEFLQVKENILVPGKSMRSERMYDQ